MNKIKITFWVTTGLLFLMEGVMPALTSQTEMAKAMRGSSVMATRGGLNSGSAD